MNQSARTLVIGSGVLVAAGIGWFALSHLVMDTSISDSIGESLGVVLGLLVVASVIGAIWSSRGNPG
jgi:hypothetical protein